VYEGLCQKDLGKSEDALAAFDDAIRLRENYKKDEKGRYPMIPEEADLVSQATLQKVLLLTEMKKYSDAIAASKDFVETTPDALTASSGFAVLAAEGDAQLAAGDQKGAGETAAKLIAADPQGPWGAKGRDITAKVFQGSGGAQGLGAEKTLEIAQNM